MATITSFHYVEIWDVSFAYEFLLIVLTQLPDSWMKKHAQAQHCTVDIVWWTLYAGHCTVDIVTWTSYGGHRTLAKCSPESVAKHLPNVPKVPNTNIVSGQHRLRALRMPDVVNLYDPQLVKD